MMAAILARVLETFIPMRLNKSGTQTPSTTLVKITGWTADAGYPGTLDAANSRLVPRAGSNKNLTVSVPCTQAWSFYGGTVHLYKNGASISSVTITSSVLTANFNLTGQTFTGTDYFEVYAVSADASYTITIQATAYMIAS